MFGAILQSEVWKIRVDTILEADRSENDKARRESGLSVSIVTDLAAHPSFRVPNETSILSYHPDA